MKNMISTKIGEMFMNEKWNKLPAEIRLGLCLKIEEGDVDDRFNTIMEFQAIKINSN